MSVDPRVSMWLNIIVAVLAGVAGGSVSLTNIMPAETARVVVGYATFMTSLVAVVNAALHATSSPNSGPLAPPQTPAAKVALALLISTVAVYAWGGARAWAQEPPAAELQFEHDEMGGTFPKEFGFPPVGSGDVIALIKSASVADLDRAAQMARLRNNTTSAQCWEGWAAVVRDIESVKAGVESTASSDETHVVSDLQTTIDIGNTLAPNGYLTAACAPLAYALKRTVPDLLVHAAKGTLQLSIGQ